MFAKCFARIILQYVPEGSGSWKYNHYFPVAEGEGKIRPSGLQDLLTARHLVTAILPGDCQESLQGDRDHNVDGAAQGEPKDMVEQLYSLFG